MVLQADSVQVEAAEEESLQNPVVHTGELTPRKVLSWLPRNATPAQQDSMIRAHIKPSEIRWSTMPDTLHLRVILQERAFGDVSLPQYYRSLSFRRTLCFIPSCVAVEWVFRATRFHIRFRATTWSHRCCCYAFVLACVAFAQSREFILRQLRKFFYTPRFGTTEISETSTELRFQLFLVLQTCLLGAIGFFLYSRASISDTFTIEQYQVIAIYAGVVASYFLFKALLYSVVGWVFFDRKKKRTMDESLSLSLLM